MQHKASPYQSVEKALKLLLAFENHTRDLGTVELSKMLGLHRSTVSRILKVLVTYNFLQQNPQTKKFSLGPANIKLAASLKRSLKTDLVQIAKPFIDNLRDDFQETVILEVPKGQHWVMTYIAQGPGPFRLVAEIGDRIPFNMASGAKAYLAFSSAELQDMLLNNSLKARTPHSTTDHTKLQKQFQKIRKNGFSYDQGELDAGIHALAVPVFNHENNPIASIVIAGIPKRINGEIDSPLVHELKKTASKISECFLHQHGLS